MLFNIYIDVLLNRLKHSGIGCQIGHNYFGSLAYADDIVLLCPNISSLNTMLKICETFSDEYKILFNASKSKLVVFGNDSNCTDVFLQGNVIVKTKVEKHVGNLVGSDFNIKSQVAQNACNQLYGKVNLLIRQMGACNCFILYKLFKNYCMSFYGCQLWNYSAFKVVNTVYVAWRKCVKRILKLPCTTHSKLLYQICHDASIDLQLHKRFLRFFISSVNSSNSCVIFATKIALNGSQSKICDSLNYICYKYHLDKFNLNINNICHLKNSYSEAEEVKAGLLRDLIHYRENNPFDGDVKIMINELCTD